MDVSRAKKSQEITCELTEQSIWALAPCCTRCPRRLHSNSQGLSYMTGYQVIVIAWGTYRMRQTKFVPARNYRYNGPRFLCDGDSD